MPIDIPTNINEFIRYEPDSGKLFWVKGVNRWSRIKPGDEVGSLTDDGYIRFDFGGSKFLSHRVAYYLSTGRQPDYIDHVNGNKSDNRLLNLRECCQSDNCKNRTSKCYYFDRQRGKWKVAVTIKGKQKSFGHYESEELAELIAEEVKHKYHGEYYFDKDYNPH